VGLGLLSVVVIAAALYVVVQHLMHRDAPEPLAGSVVPRPEPEAPAEKPAPRPPGESAPSPPAQPGQERALPKDPLAGYVPPGKEKEPVASLPPALRLPGEEPEWVSSLPPEQQARVNKAIERGVAYLKKYLAGTSDQWLSRPGGWALAGLTLLACGVPSTDPAVQAAAIHVRSGRDRVAETYDQALAVLFLDRLADRQDRDLLRTFTLRLMAGQNTSGGWTYTCPILTPGEQAQFLNALESLSPPPEAMLAPDGANPAKPPPPVDRKSMPEAPKPPLSKDKLPAGVKNLPVVQFEPGWKPDLRVGNDNSNTQFAILAVWTARKYGLPVDRTLSMVEARFRATQHDNGTWTYSPSANNWPDSMTCAGLLGLAVGHGIVRSDSKEASAKDPAIEKGLRYLGSRIGRRAPKGSDKLIDADAHGDLYCLWSIERVAVLYDLKTITGKDWYAWGADVLVEHQDKKDGSWNDTFPGVPDTCFALLFLKRTNVAQDLTAKLRTFTNLVDESDSARSGKDRPK
jgi:hypothetical protein